MEHSSSHSLVRAAMFSALFCLSTALLRIPSPLGGYLNAGDILVLPTGALLGPLWGGLAAGLGSCLADILSGYALYAPASFLIRGLMTALSALLLRRISGGKLSILLLGGLPGELLMVGGYFAYAALALGFGRGAAADIPGNCVQGALGLLGGSLLTRSLRHWAQK